MLDHHSVAAPVTRQLARLTGATAAFHAGSVVEGFGNEWSDIDVYLLGPGLARTRRQLAVGRLRVDVHQVDEADLPAAVERVLAAPARSDGSDGWASIADVDLAVQVWGARVVVDSAVLAAARDALHADPLPLRRQVLARWLDTIHGAQEDLRGLLAGADVDAAVLVARRALTAAAKAVAAAAGELFLAEKWAWRQLERSGPAGFPLADLRAVHRCELPGGLGRLEALVQTCAAACATAGWHGVGLDRWPSWTGGAGLRRIPGSYPRAYDDGVVVSLPDRRVRLSPAAAAVWALCNGGATGDIVAYAGRLGGESPAYAGLTVARGHEILAILCRAGLIVES
jgi:predicted nucleotidyltransferase